MYKRGSEWRKWDLHVHSPASFFWSDGKKLYEMDDEEKEVAIKHFIKVVNESDVAVFCIMDYWTFDWYIELKRYLEKNPNELKKTVFPGMELRIESPTSYRLNIHVILSNQLTEQELDDFKSELVIRSIAKKLSNESLQKFALTLDESKAKIHGYKNPNILDKSKQLELGSKTAEITQESLAKAFDHIPIESGYILMPYDTSDGLLNLDWTKHPHSDNYFMQSSHIFESRKQVNIDLFNGVRTNGNEEFFENFQKTLNYEKKPCVSGSDAHKYSNYGKFPSNKITWIKANPTFDGLKQVINEPRDRVFIGTIPPKKNMISLNKTKYIDKIKINKVHDKLCDEIWFDNELKINKDLVAIIGNKGNGKSALADILAFCGNAKLIDETDFSFLNTKKFKKNNLAEKFEVSLFWEDGTCITKVLSEKLNETDVEKVKYLPQKYIESICTNDYNKFQDEINKVVFSHIPESEKLGEESLTKLIKLKTNSITTERNQLKVKLKELAEKKIALLLEYSETEIIKINKLLIEKNKEINDHLEYKTENLIEVFKPDTDPTLKEEQRAKFKKIERFNKHLNVLEKYFNKNQEIINNSTKQLNTIENTIHNISLHIKEHQNFKDNLSNIFHKDNIDIKIDDILQMSYNKASLQKLKKSKTDYLNKLLKKFEDAISTKDKKQLRINTLNSELNDAQKEYQNYLSALSEWDKTNLSLIEEKLKLNKKLDFKDNSLGVEIKVLNKEMYSEYNKLFNTFKIELKVYQDLYKPVLEFVNIEKKKRSGSNLKGFIEFTTNISQDKNYFSNKILDFFDNRRKKFDDLEVKDLINEDEVISFKNIIKLNHKLEKLLQKDKNLEQQFRDSKKLIDFYMSLWDLESFSVEYDILLDGKKVLQLSPGERGALLIIFYLLIDKSDIPLIIDQPEDNLDNESVFEYLVPYIKSAKQRRQIIIVTHNPNIAVVSDAEQIIFTEINKSDKNKVTYKCGAIEDELINEKITKVLEGTLPAFDNRTKKYFRFE